MNPAPTLVVIPTYNEAENIGSVADQVLRLDASFHILVVDDGSPDGTGDLVESLQERHPERIHLIRREGKQGLGTAYIAVSNTLSNEIMALSAKWMRTYLTTQLT